LLSKGPGGQGEKAKGLRGDQLVDVSLSLNLRNEDILKQDASTGNEGLIYLKH